MTKVMFVASVALLTLCMVWVADAGKHIFQKGDYKINLLYGCAGEEGAKKYSDDCRRALATSKILYQLILSHKKKDEIFHFMPVEDKDDIYEIGVNCSGDNCKRHWSYRSINYYIRSSDEDKSRFKITKRGTGYQIRIADKCTDLNALSGPKPCGYEISYTSSFGNKWMNMVKSSENVNYEIIKA